MKKVSRVLALILVCSLLLCGAVNATGSFPDVPEAASYYEAVEFLAELKIFGGDDKGNFNPNNSITRAEAAAVVCRLLGIEAEAKTIKKSAFKDVSNSHWACGYIAKAAELGIVGGYGNGKFGPSDTLTKEQIVKMLVCAWGFGDEAGNYGGWPKGYAKVAENYGIVENMDTVSNAPASRAQVAEWIYNLLNVTMNWGEGVL